MGLAHLAAWLGLVLVGIIVTFVGGTFVYAASGAARIVTHLAIAGLLGAWAVAIAREPSRGPRGPLVAPALAVVGAGLASAALSPVPRIALEGAIGMAAAMAALLLLVRIVEVPWLRARLEVIAIALPALLAALVIGEAILAWMEWWDLVGSVQMPPLRLVSGGSWLGGPNVAAAALLVGYPTSLTLLRRRGAPPSLLAGHVAAGLLAMLFTGSRGGLMGLAVMTMVLVLAIYMRRRSAPSQAASGVPAGRPALRLRWLGWLSLAVTLGSAALLGPAFLARFANLAGSVTQRADIWLTAWNMFAHQPLTGNGPGTFPLLAPSMAPPLAQSLVVPHAHNTILHVLSELGLIGGASAAWLIGVIALLLARSLQDPGSRRAALAAVAGLAGFATASMVDHTLGLGAMSLIVALPVALGAHGPDAPTGASRPRALRLHLRYLPIALCLLGTAVVVRMDISFVRGMAADDAAASGSWEVAAAAYRDAVSAGQSLPLDLLGLGIASAQLGEYDEAEAALAKAIELDQSAHTHLLLARVRLQLGDRLSAADLALRALAINPDDPVVAINAGTILEAAGDDVSAFDAYATAFVLSPELAASGWWLARTSAGPEQLLAEALHRVQGDKERSALLQAFGGDASGARESAQALPASDRALVDALATLVTTGPDSARAQLRVLLRDDPQAASAALWLSRIERGRGELEAAERYVRWATILAGWPAASNPRIGSTIVEGSDLTVRPVPTNYPWAVYGRRGPGNFTVPGLLGIDPWPVPVGRSFAW